MICKAAIPCKYYLSIYNDILTVIRKQIYNNALGSDWEVNDLFALIADDEIVDEIRIEEALHDSGDEGSEDNSFPVENPELHICVTSGRCT